MLNKTSKLVFTIVATLLIATGLSFAQDNDMKDHKHSGDKNGMSSSTKVDSTKMDMSKDHMKMDHDKTMNTEKDMMKDMSSIVRKGVIDLNAIDENGDGKVYQDVMDWNVISDEPGMCPACGMKLKEVTLDEAKANLEKNGFKVK